MNKEQVEKIPTKAELVETTNQWALSEQTKAELFNLEAIIKAATIKRDELKANIKALMESSGIVAIEQEGEYKITYVPEYDREYFNKSGFRKDHPDIYDEYISMRHVDGSVRITIKDSVDENKQ